MILSRATKLPELAGFPFPSSMMEIRLSDMVIFSSLLDSMRSLRDIDGYSRKGDYVLYTVTRPGGKKELRHIRLGCRHTPWHDSVLRLRRPGDSFSAILDREECLVEVLKVERPVEFLLTDENIASLGIDGVSSLSDYRRLHVSRHGRAVAIALFHKMGKRVMAVADSATSFHLVGGEEQRWNMMQRRMLDSLPGNVDAALRLRDRYGKGRTVSIGEVEIMFCEDNSRNFRFSLFGRSLAEADGHVVPEWIRDAAVKEFSDLYGKGREDMDALEDETLVEYYIQYGLDRLLMLYLERVEFSVEGETGIRLGKEEIC